MGEREREREREREIETDRERERGFIIIYDVIFTNNMRVIIHMFTENVSNVDII